MRRSFGLVSIAAVCVCFGVALAAQQTTEVHPGKGGSPHVKTEWTIDGANVAITYGRPHLKGRTVGTDVEPRPGRVWRTGADEATTLTTDRDLMIGDAKVPAGSYTLYTLTDERDTWTLIVNKQTGQWGTEYDESQDLARVNMKVDKLQQPVEQFTISLDPANGARALKLEWGHYRASAPLRVVGQTSD